MWVFLNNAFISVVSHKSIPQSLLVRARFPNDIQAVFPNTQISITPEADYLYRAIISRDKCAQVLSQKISLIDYDNFKNTVQEPDRHDLYVDVWSLMLFAQAKSNNTLGLK